MSNFVAPLEVLEAYYPQGIEHERKLAGGIVNTTLLVSDVNNRRTVLQRLSPIFNETMADDFDVISGHLRQDGWNVPEAIKSTANTSYVADGSGRLWRSFSYIESDGVVASSSPEASVALGGLLGALHKSLARLEYQPKFELPHFHNTEYIAARLQALLPKIKEVDSQNLGGKFIELSTAQSIPKKPKQLIHGDPKTNNALFKDGLPFTFIDFDTMMQANPLVDLGDMLRSVSGKVLSTGSAISAEQLRPIIEAYYRNAQPNISLAEFTKQALNAGQILALELGMRYLTDSVEVSYFDLDTSKYSTLQEQNTAKAGLQWQVYQALAA